MWWGSFILGGLIFLFIYGWQVLDVAKISWLLGGVDLTQHYLGWAYFRQAPWQFPFGLMTSVTYPHPLSVIYTDAIPLCAVFFKMLSPLLPEPFQYFGFWGLFSFCMTGGVGGLLLRRFQPYSYAVIPVSLFFSLNAVILARMYVHTALASQWVLLLPLCFLLYDREGGLSWRRCFIWCAFGTLGVLVHGYFVPMIGLLLLCYLGIKRQALSLHWFLTFLMSFAFSVFAVMYVLGAFSSGLSMGTGAKMGAFSANALAFFNPGHFAWLLPAFPIPLIQAWEGMTYLGIGGIAALGAASVLYWHHAVRLTQSAAGKRCCRMLVLCGAVFYLLAVLPHFYVVQHAVFYLHYPQWLKHLLSIFRANGRFIWLPMWLLLLFGVGTLLRAVSWSRWAYCALALCLLLQSVEVAPAVSMLRSWYVDTRLEPYRYQQMRADAGIRSLMAGHQRVIILGHDNIVHIREIEKWQRIACAAEEVHIPINEVYTARRPDELLKKDIEQYWQDLRAGSPEQGTLYVFPDPYRIREVRGLYIYQLNGYWFGTTEERDLPYHSKT